MKKRTIGNLVYHIADNGILIPEFLVRESPIKIRTPKDCLPLFQIDRLESQERFIVVTLDGNSQVIKKHVITIGLANQSQIHPRETFYVAIQDRAVSILLAHNHPSGNMEPSESDLVATKRLSECGKTMGIPVLDHLILTAESFLSIRERFPFYF